MPKKYGCRLLTVKEIFDGHGDFNLVMMQKKLVPNYETFDDSFVFTGVQIGKRTAFGSWKAPRQRQAAAVFLSWHCLQQLARVLPHPV